MKIAAGIIVIANISPNECAIETAAISELSALTYAFTEDDELHAKPAEIDNPTVEYSAVSEVPREDATNYILAMT